jgi:phage tail sheath protein FI
MPEYLAPGVYVEEAGFRSKTIEGVATGTTAFVGVTRRGPFAVDKCPKELTSFAEFERIYGGAKDLAGLSPKTNYVAHAARVFFEQGGKRLFLARVKTASVAATESANIVRGATKEKNWADALRALLTVDKVSIVAAPGSTELGPNADAIQSQLVAHAESRGAYRIAVLDIPKGKSPEQAREYRVRFDSMAAAFYYPWVLTANPGFDANDPTSQKDLMLPPSGFICGIYARNDIQRGAAKALANEEIRGAAGFEREITQAEQDMLNTAGVNCLRYFPGRGYCVWGARTASSDPEWKYVNVRRHLIYLEHSIDKGTQWVVFEPNGEKLWAAVRKAVSNFLYNEWRNGALQGQKPEEAFFVRCDRTTMTQNDLDNGRLICLIGVAPIKPAEFVIFRIGQKTA